MINYTHLQMAEKIKEIYTLHPDKFDFVTTICDEFDCHNYIASIFYELIKVEKNVGV